MEEALKTARLELDAARDRKGELAAEQARLHSDAQHMAETCIQELSQPREELLADESLARLAGEELANEEALYKEMRTRLENMGPVNMMALEEYQETAQRHEFLETQRQDLLQSIENTQNTIKEIDTISRQKFEEAFNRINENFSRTFSKLFGGGQAFMRLTDLENSIESGIDVVASPPGKKLQNVLLLSGGEKALTALALLVGIFQYQPSPFCILDEVDAPLDEANIGRFTELVREMSGQTQFIIITHSKKTMGIAPVMYGVTMQEPGVSKLVSVRFQEEPARMAGDGVSSTAKVPNNKIPRGYQPTRNWFLRRYVACLRLYFPAAMSAGLKLIAVSFPPKSISLMLRALPIENHLGGIGLLGKGLHLAVGGGNFLAAFEELHLCGGTVHVILHGVVSGRQLRSAKGCIF